MSWSVVFASSTPSCSMSSALCAMTRWARTNTEYGRKIMTKSTCKGVETEGYIHPSISFKEKARFGSVSLGHPA